MYRWTFADGRESTQSYAPAEVNWKYLQPPYRVVRCERVEPKKETRWRCTWDKGETTLQDTPPQDTFWQEAAYRDCLIKCERVEVEV